MTTEHELLDLQQTLYTSKNPTRRYLHCARRDWIHQAIERYSQGDAMMTLEVGPGSGGYLPVLAERSETTYAADIEPAFLEQARRLQEQHPQIRVEVDDITKSQLPEKTFDMILCTEVVEHFDGSQQALLHMHRLLKPGGILILTTPQKYSPLEMTAKIAFLPGIIDIVRLIYREPILETGHINLMTAATLEEQIRNAGFSTLERHKLGMYIPVLAEFAGQLALSFEQWLERRILGSALDEILWTQCYILRRA